MSDTLPIFFAISLASLTFVITVIWGSPFIRILRRFKIGKRIRVDGPQTHYYKMGTPTMGGLMITIPVVIVTLVLNFVRLTGPGEVEGLSILLPLGVLIAYGALGIWDDWEGIHGRRAKTGEGMLGRYKFAFQWLIAIIAAVVLSYVFDIHSFALPGYPNKFEMNPLIYTAIAAFVIVSTSNAVNMTDGLDGLAGLVSVTCFATYGMIAILQQQWFLSQFNFTIVGALFAFLWYNVHPASLFMGDTGSGALGGVLAVVALMTGQWLLLIVIAIVPVMETVSVMLQVASAKLSRRYLGVDLRPFKMTPIHHHFELMGWSETQVAQRFWLISIMAGLLGIALASL